MGSDSNPRGLAPSVVTVQGQRLAVLRAGLSRPAYLGSPRASGLDEHLAAFGPADLGRLPAQDGVGQR